MSLRREGWAHRLSKYPVPLEWYAATYFRDGHPPENVEVTVRCNGQNHKIMFDGQYLRLCNHPQLELDLTLQAFGGTCRCLQVLKAWRDRDASSAGGLPDALRHVVAHWHRPLQHARRVARNLLADPSSSRFVYSNAAGSRPNNHIRLNWLRWHYASLCSIAVQSCLHQLTYKRMHSTRPNIYVAPIVNNADDRQLRASGSRLEFSPGWGWKYRVFDAEMAVIDGMLVLDVLYPRDVEHFLTRVRCGTGGSKTPWWAAFGIEPDFSQGPYVLVFKETARGFNPWPARVLVTKDETGCERKTLELYRKPRQTRQG